MRIRLAAPLLAALLVAASSGGAATFHGPPRVTQSVLANGLRVVVIEEHAVRLAHVALWYRYGSVNDPPGHAGLAHALEHMMFRGSAALPGPNALDYADARLGIDRNAETDFESTHYYETVPVDELAVALRIEADRMRGLQLRPRDWALERRAVLAELSGDQSSSVDALESAVRAAAYGSSPFAHHTVGTVHDLMQTGAGDLRRAYDAAYRPDNATLVVTGDVDPAHVVALARTFFGPIRGHARVATVRTERPATRGFVVRLNSVAQRIVDVAVESHGQQAADAAAEGVAAELLDSKHAASRTALIDAGPCAWYDVDDDTQLYGGLYHIVCHLDRDAKPVAAIGSIRAALRRLAAHLPATAVQYARRDVIAGTAVSRDSLSAEADLFGSSIALQRTDPRRFDADTARVSGAQVAAVLRRWADPVGVGIAEGSWTFSMQDSPARRTRSEHVPPSADDAGAAEPAWVRDAAVSLRAPAQTELEAFALPNGLRVFVAPRRDNGTVYLKAGFDQAPPARRLSHTQSDVIDRFTEQHGLTIEGGLEPTMHGVSSDLTPLLGFLAGLWTAPRAALSPEHAWIVVAGDADPSKVRLRVAQMFGDWRGTATTSPQPAPTAPAWLAAAGRSRILTMRISTPSIRAILVGPAPGRDDPDFAAMTILNVVLGARGDFDSRLVRELRSRRGLVYSIASTYYVDEKALLVAFEAPRHDFPAARRAVRGVLEGLRTPPATPAELERARRKLLAQALRDEADVNAVLSRLASAARRHEPPDDLANLAARYDAVTLDDLRRVAQTRLTPETMTEFDEGPVPK